MAKRPDRLERMVEGNIIFSNLRPHQRAEVLWVLRRERARLKRKVKGLARYNEGRFIMLSGSNGEWIKRDDVLKMLEN